MRLRRKPETKPGMSNSKWRRDYPDRHNEGGDNVGMDKRS